MPIHVTPIPRLTVLTVPALTLGTANAAGSASTAIASDSTLLVYDTTVPTTIVSGDSAAAGSQATAARRDHTHGMYTATVAATAAEMEAATSNTVFATPGRTQNAPGVSKAYLRIATDGASFSGSYNVASVTDTAVGTRVIVITTDFSDTAYSVVTTLADEHNRIVRHASFATGSVNLYINALSSAHNYEGADSATSTSLFGDQ